MSPNRPGVLLRLIQLFEHARVGSVADEPHGQISQTDVGAGGVNTAEADLAPWNARPIPPYAK